MTGQGVIYFDVLGTHIMRSIDTSVGQGEHLQKLKRSAKNQMKAWNIS